jgi:hypothetical protein
MGPATRLRASLAALTLSSVVMACGAGPLSDAETVWCKANLPSVAASADALGLPPPDGESSWAHWAVVLVAGEQMLGGSQWDAMTIERDRPNRDRACRAAYSAR